MDHLFDCEFRCEDSCARWISVDLGKTILVVPELAGFSHSQGHSRPGRASSKPGHVRHALKAEATKILNAGHDQQPGNRDRVLGAG